MNKQSRYVIVLIGFALLSLCFVSPLSPFAPRSLQHAWQLGHIALFCVWTWLFFPPLLGVCKGPKFAIALGFIFSLLIGLAIEWLQTRIGRDFSLNDLLFDQLGYLTGLCLLMFHRQLQPGMHWQRVLVFFTATAIASYTLPLVLVLTDEAMMYRSFPLLSNFDSRLQTGRWGSKAKRVNLLTSAGEHDALRVSLKTSRYSGTSLKYMIRNWQGSKNLEIKLYNPTPSPLNLNFRIHDKYHYGIGRGDYHDRFNKTHAIHPGWNTLVFSLTEVQNAPQSRQMDMQNIQELGLFSKNLTQARSIYIKSVRLSL